MNTQPDALRLADELEMWTLGEPAAAELRRLHAENVELREAIKRAIRIEQAQPVAWVYPGALEAFKKGNPWVAYGSNGDGPHSDGVQRIPLYLNDAVARRVEPRASESGAGFESLPASPHKMTESA